MAIGAAVVLENLKLAHHILGTEEGFLTAQLEGRDETILKMTTMTGGGLIGQCLLIGNLKTAVGKISMQDEDTMGGMQEGLHHPYLCPHRLRFHLHHLETAGHMTQGKGVDRL